MGDGESVVVDLLMCALFVAIVVTPPIVDGILRSRSCEGKLQGRGKRRWSRLMNSLPRW
jgi:hypothetical protein